MKHSLLFLTLIGLAACHSPAPSTPLGGTIWNLTSLQGEAVTLDPPPTLQIDLDQSRASGRGGVNRFTGSCAVNGTSLSFGRLAMTRMAGPADRMELESRYVAALEKVTAWNLKGSALQLLAGDQVIASFVASPSSK